MKFFSAHLENLGGLYTNSLQRALDMERHIARALPGMVKKASDPRLKQALQMHLEETRTQVSRIEMFLNETLGKASTVKCKGILALMSEAEDIIASASDQSVRDAALIAAAQMVEHHEMAVYGTLRSWAFILGETAQARALGEILEQGKAADALLTGISGRVNQDAQFRVSHAA